MVKAPIQTGAVDGIITLIEIPKNLNANANVIANKLEIKKLKKIDLGLFV